MRTNKQEHDKLRTDFAEYKEKAASKYVNREELHGIRKEILDLIEKTQDRTEKCLDKIGVELSEVRKRLDVIIGGKE